MNNNYRKKALITVTVFCMAVSSITACGGKDKAAEDTSGSEISETKDSSTENSGEEKQAKVDGLNYTSVDGKIQITLPGESWKNIADTDNAKTFQSDEGTINITYASGDGIGDLMVPADQDAFVSMINGGMADTPFDVMNYENLSSGDTRCYKAVLHYTKDGNPDKYGVYYGIYEGDEGYTAAAIITKDDKTLLKTVEESVYGFQILK
ncbi:MAG: hypothetical protein PHN80_16905 [Hespellia sp.]|nr:hypothetical protein [Hespellia sp.]